VVEPQDHVLAGLRNYGLGSTSIMLRLMTEESGCIAVVERGVAMQNLQQERSLAAGGQLQADSNIGGGQMVGADFVMTPVVQFSGESGGVGGMVGGLLGRAVCVRACKWPAQRARPARWTSASGPGAAWAGRPAVATARRQKAD
jgi:hypothetical protein